MFAYVLTFALVVGSGNPVEIEIPNLRSVEQCQQFARQHRAELPRGTRMIRPVCAQRGYFT